VRKEKKKTDFEIRKKQNSEGRRMGQEKKTKNKICRIHKIRW
jgi:hypothetical protein